MIQPFVQDRLTELRALCSSHRVRRLELFGSAATGRFDPKSSDLDFLVEFDDRMESGYFEAYFGLKESLERLFGRPVDLVMSRAAKNPYFLESIAESRSLLFAA